MSKIQPTNVQDTEFVQLYSKMADALGVSGVVGRNPSALLSIQLPGVSVPPGLNPNDPETQYYISNFLNVALECDYVATAKVASVSDTYKLILDSKETPDVSLSAKEKDELHAARKLLFDHGGQPTAEYDSYFKCATDYFAAQDAFDVAEATQRNGGPTVPPSVRDALKAAEHAWDTTGHKLTVEEALATIIKYEGREPLLYWQNLTDRFARHTKMLKNGSTYQEIDSFPRYQDWFKQDLWTPFSFDERDYDRQRRSGGTGMNAGRACCCSFSNLDRSRRVQHLNAKGICGFGPGLGSCRPTPDYTARHDHNVILASWREDSADDERPLPQELRTTAVKLDCSFKRINILRPWMDSAVFSSRLWRWSPSGIGFGITISTGGSVAGNKPATGVMPVLPTTALIAKDIVLTSSSGPLRDWLKRQFAEGRVVRYGPFRFNAVRDLNSKALVSGSPAIAVASGGPQMFGYISAIFSECPNPDLTLPWPT